MKNNIFVLAYNALMSEDVDSKLVQVQALADLAKQDKLSYTTDTIAVLPVVKPGRPSLPQLVRPNQVPKFQLSSKQGMASLLHALTHIEFNAINLALDAVYRFRGLPKLFYENWLMVAAEEAYHFSLLREHLQGYGYLYGDFVAHNGLWEMAHATNYSALARMALVPRLMEARGLDVSPGIRHKFSSLGDKQAADIMLIIMQDEIGHVAIGNFWYHYLCRQENLPALETFKELLDKHAKGFLKPPIQEDLRKQAGFTEDELSFILSIMCNGM